MRDSTKNLLQQICVICAIIVAVFLLFKHAHFDYKFYWAVLWEVNPTYKEIFGLWLLRGLLLTLEISLISTGIALVMGTIFGIARLSRFTPTYAIATAYVEFFRNTPLLVQLFFWYFAFPLVLPESLNTYLNAHNYEFWAATFGLGIYTGAFVAEVSTGRYSGHSPWAHRGSRVLRAHRRADAASCHPAPGIPHYHPSARQ